MGARNLIEIILQAKDQASGTIAGTTKSISGLDMASKIASAVGIIGLTASIGAMIDKAAKAEREMTLLNQVIKSTGGKAGVTAGMASNLAASLSSMSGESKNSLIETERMLLTFTAIGSEVFPQATEAVLNLSVALGQDVKAGAIQVGKALQEPIQGVTALRRVGVQLTDEMEAQVKGFMDMGDVASAQRIILRELEAEFGGAAKAVGQTFSGQLNIAKNQIGSVAKSIGAELLPPLTSTLKLFTEAPEPIKKTVLQVAALGIGALSLTRFLPQVASAMRSVIATMQAFGMAQSLLLGGIVGIGLAVAGLIIHHRNLEEAHKKEAASIAESSATYPDYLNKLSDAELGEYRLTEALWAHVKARDAANQAEEAADLEQSAKGAQGWLDILDSASWAAVKEGEAAGDLQGRLDRLSQEFKNNADAMTEHELVVLSDRAGVLELARAYTESEEEAKRYTDIILAGTRAEQNRRAAVANEAGLERDRVRVWKDMQDASLGQADAAERQEKSLRDLARTSGLSVDQVRKLKVEFGLSEEKILKVGEDLAATNDELYDLSQKSGVALETLIALRDKGFDAKAIEAYVQALEDAQARMEGMSGAWATGLLKLRDLDKEAKKGAEDYAEALQDLKKDAGSSYAEIRKKYEESLPDATSVSDRAAMAGDAWDEWALRMGALLDGVQGGQEQGWMATLRAMTDGTKLSLDATGGNVNTWLENLKTAFYANKLPDLIDREAPEWKAHAAKVAEAQGEETAAVAKGIADRQAALEKANAELLAQQKQTRQDAMVQLSLQLAQESGTLQTWAAERFGDRSVIADSADEVFALLQSGMLSLDPKLKEIIGGYATDLTSMLDTTAGSAATTNTALGTLLDESSMKASTLKTTFATSVLDITTKTKEIVGKAGQMKMDVLAAFSDLQTLAKPVGTALVNGLKDGIKQDWDTISQWLGEQIQKIIADTLANMGAGAGGGGGVGGGGQGAGEMQSLVPAPLTVAGDTYYVTVTDQLAAAMFFSNVRDRRRARLNVAMGG